MKQLHRGDLWGWSVFDAARNLDFNSVAWIRSEGNLLVDPMPMCEHDLAQLTELGGAAHIVITTSDHLRDAVSLADRFGAEIIVPQAEREGFPTTCARFIGEGDERLPGLQVFEMNGSKTPGELVLVLEQTTLITGDLVRGQCGANLNLLPDAKLSDPAAARQSVRSLAELDTIETVLVGDGWHLWTGGTKALHAISS